MVKPCLRKQTQKTKQKPEVFQTPNFQAKNGSMQMILIHVENDGLRAKAEVGYIHQSQSQTHTNKKPS